MYVRTYAKFSRASVHVRQSCVRPERYFDWDPGGGELNVHFSRASPSVLCTTAGVSSFSHSLDKGRGKHLPSFWNTAYASKMLKVRGRDYSRFRGLVEGNSSRQAGADSDTLYKDYIHVIYTPVSKLFRWRSPFIRPNETFLPFLLSFVLRLPSRPLVFSTMTERKVVTFLLRSRLFMFCTVR